MNNVLVMPLVLRWGLLCTLLWGLQGGVAWGQAEPSEILKLPDFLTSPKVDKMDSLQVSWDSSSGRKSQPWMVYSDRAKNEVLSEPGGPRSAHTLGFLQPLYVVNEEGEYLQVLSTSKAPRAREVPEGSTVLGWVHRDKLLLWSHGLNTPDGALSIRGVVQNKVDYVKGPQKGKADLVDLRDQPSEVGKALEEVRLNRFFYVYKVIPGNSPEEGFVLLGRQSEYTAEDASRVLVGWAPFSRLVTWNHRIALEPNWEELAWAEREKKQQAQVLKDKKKARAYAEGRVNDAGGPLWDADPGINRRPGEWKRFPVIEPEELEGGNLLKVGVMGQIYSVGSGDRPTVDEGDLARVQDKLDRIGTARQQTNIVFVVDGTKSFKDYYRPIVEALKRTMKEFESSRSTYRFGAVVYRDSQEVKEKWLEKTPIGTGDEVAAFLPNKEYYKDDKTDAEAVNYGLQAALGLFKSVQGSERQTNVMVLIGDAGTHHRQDEITFVPPQAMYEDMVRLNTHFLAVQVRRLDDPVYERFFLDQKELAGVVAMRAWQELRDSFPLLASQFKTPVWMEDGSTIRLEGGPLRMEVLGQPLKGEMKPAELGRKMVTLLAEIDAQNERLQRELIRLKDGGSASLACGPSNRPESGQSDAEPALGCAVLEVLQSAGLTPKDISLLQQDKYQLYAQGVVAMKVEGQTYPLFKRTLLLSRTELDDLRGKVESLYKATSTTQRKSLQAAWLTILGNYLGSGSEHELAQLTLAQANQKVFGLPGTTPFLTQVKLEDITNPDAFADDQLTEYTTRVIGLLSRLKALSLHPENEATCFDAQEEAQCWVEEDLLP